MIKNENYKNFECINSLNFGKIPIKQFQSTKTGLTISLAEIEGPTVNGFFTISTEASDHDGSPHCKN
jgi:Zn-dependent M16 (insulinase) family peptidase